LDSLVYVDSTVTHKAAAASIRVDVLDPSPESDLSMPDNELAVRTQVVDLGALPSCFQVRYSVTEDLTQVPNWVIDLDLPWRNWDRLPPGESFPVHQTQGLRDFIFRLSTSYAEIREPLGVFAIDVHID
jgi:hypothetical protein